MRHLCKYFLIRGKHTEKDKANVVKCGVLQIWPCNSPGPKLSSEYYLNIDKASMTKWWSWPLNPDKTVMSKHHIILSNIIWNISRNGVVVNIKSD